MWYFLHITQPSYSGRPHIVNHYLMLLIHITSGKCVNDVFPHTHIQGMCVFWFIGDLFYSFWLFTFMRTLSWIPAEDVDSYFFVPSKMRSSCWRTLCGRTESDAVITLIHPYSGFPFLFRSDGRINAWRLFHVESSRASYKNKSQWNSESFAFFRSSKLFIKNQFKKCSADGLYYSGTQWKVSEF